MAADQQHHHVKSDQEKREVGKPPALALGDEQGDETDEGRDHFQPPGHSVKRQPGRPRDGRSHHAKEDEIGVGFQERDGIGRIYCKPSTFGALALPKRSRAVTAMASARGMVMFWVPPGAIFSVRQVPPILA